MLSAFNIEIAASRVVFPVNSPPLKKRARKMDGRREKRTPRTLRVLLSSGAQPVVAEYASTENVSAYGVRVRTDRPWKRDASVMIKSTLGEPWARGRVVYCQMLKGHTFALGLELLTRPGDWLTPA